MADQNPFNPADRYRESVEIKAQNGGDQREERERLQEKLSELAAKRESATTLIENDENNAD